MLITSRGFAAGVLGLRPDDRTLSVSKLFFAYGLGNGMYFPFSVGASTVLNPDRPRADRIIDLVARHKPTVFFARSEEHTSELQSPCNLVCRLLLEKKKKKKLRLQPVVA